MARDDWFRRTTWTSDDEIEFLSRLERSRSEYNKAQYLRIQAWHLQETGRRKYLKSAVGLLDRLFETCPATTELASAHLQKGQCLLGLGQEDEGLAELRAATDAQRAGSVPCQSHLWFGWEVVRRGRRDLGDEALSLLEELTEEHDFLFPINAYRHFAILALVCHWRGDADAAARFAVDALKAAARDRSALSFHPNVGLVRDPDRKVHARLKRLARSAVTDRDPNRDVR